MKEEVGLEFPDFGNIEIKCRRSYSKALIISFHAVPVGGRGYELKRFRDCYGYRDPKDLHLKCFYVEVGGNEFVKVRSTMLKFC